MLTIIIILCVFITIFGATLGIILGKRRNAKNNDIRSKIYSGDYKVYLDGQKIEDPLGIDVSCYNYELDEYNKIIRFTTVHTTNVTVENHRYY